MTYCKVYFILNLDNKLIFREKRRILMSFKGLVMLGKGYKGPTRC